MNHWTTGIFPRTKTSPDSHRTFRSIKREPCLHGQQKVQRRSRAQGSLQAQRLGNAFTCKSLLPSCGTYFWTDCNFSFFLF